MEKPTFYFAVDQLVEMISGPMLILQTNWDQNQELDSDAVATFLSVLTDVHSLQSFCQDCSEWVYPESYGLDYKHIYIPFLSRLIKLKNDIPILRNHEMVNTVVGYITDIIERR